MQEPITMTPDEFTEKFAKCEPTDDYFVLNHETLKLELHFEKSTYDALTDEQKHSIKSNFLWGRRSGCWISRAKDPNLFYAIQCAKSIGLTDAGTSGERLSFAEQQQRKAERAEHRAERLENAADNAEKRAERLQAPLDHMHGDIAFFTQPNINTSAGRAFTKKRNKMFESFERGFEELQTAKEYDRRAEIARQTADHTELKSPSFCMRRIEERKKDIRAYERNIKEYEGFMEAIEKGEKQIGKYGIEYNYTREKLEEYIAFERGRVAIKQDELEYYENALEAAGGVKFSKDNIKVGYVVMLDSGYKVRVKSVGPKNFFSDNNIYGYAYAEITKIVSANEDEPQLHPFKVGDTFKNRWSGVHTIVKTTDKTVVMRMEDGTEYRVKPRLKHCRDNETKWALTVGKDPLVEIYYR